MCKSLKTVAIGPDTMYGLCKVHKKEVNSCPAFRSLLSALHTSTNHLAKILVPILDPSTKSKYTVKKWFHFAEAICEQDPSLSMGSLNEESLFTNIPLDKTNDICINQLLENIDTVEVFTML